VLNFETARVLAGKIGMDRYMIKVIIITIVIILGFGGIFFFLQKQERETQALDVQLFVSPHVSAGETVLYRVVYNNTSAGELLEVNATILYPEGSLIVNEDSQEFERISSETKTVGALSPRAQGEISFEALLFGTVDEVKRVNVTLEYKTKTSNAAIRVARSADIEIGSLPLALTFTFPSKVNLGEEFEFSLNYISTSRNPFPQQRIIMEYPETFEFLASSPVPSRGQATWVIGDLFPSSSGEIKIKGVITGEAGDERLFKAELGMLDLETFTSYLASERRVGVSLPGFRLSQNVTGARGGTVMPGEKLNWEIDYKNLSSEILEGLEVLVFLEGETFDYSSLVADRGTFLKDQKMLRWDKDSVSDFVLVEPAEEGRLEFSLTLRLTPPIENFDDKNFTVGSRAVARVRGVTLAEDIQEFKVNSRFEFYQRGFRNLGPFENTGPIPPRVGESTTYTLSWQVFNSSNVLSNVVVRGAIPSYVDWEGVVVPDEENLVFNPNTGEIVWAIKDLEQGVGILLPIRQVSFQISITPDGNDVGKIRELIGGSNAVARDSFTGAGLESFSVSIDTSLADDPSVSVNDGIVR